MNALRNKMKHSKSSSHSKNQITELYKEIKNINTNSQGQVNYIIHTQFTHNGIPNVSILDKLSQKIEVARQKKAQQQKKEEQSECEFKGKGEAKER